ncbi:MAG: MgtC/SapB family protein, partial [Hyphomicrobiaceae bacterium]
MITSQDPWLPRLALALAIGLLLGVERGWQMRTEQQGRRVAGIRTFALLGLIGGLAGFGVQSDSQTALLAAILVAGALGALLLGYRVDMRRDGNVSATSTLAGVLTLALGAMATAGEMALASVGAGATVILLASREPLHRAIQATSAGDLKALLRLVLVVFIVLPLLPDADMGPFGTLNPFRLWTVVVITGSISFLGYFLGRWLGERR